jgi:hypothetical protein
VQASPEAASASPAAAEPAAAARAAAPTASCKSSKKAKQDLAGPCCHCGAVSSPQWRKGPKGKPVLCNACGIRFLRNRTLTKVVVSVTACKQSQRNNVQGTAATSCSSTVTE